MMLQFRPALLALATLTMGAVTTRAFVPIPAVPPAAPRTTTSGSGSTRLYISSWGISSGPSSRSLTEPKDIAKRIQDYLPEPEAVEARANVDGTITVSGAANARERTDQFLFDLLNHQDSAFEFNKIVAAVRDPALAKKRLLSRSARYTGLLDKLDFVATPAEQQLALPTAEQLRGSKSWLAVVDVGTDDNDSSNKDSWKAQCLEIARTASAVDGLENVAVLLTGANELAATDCQAVLDSFKATNKKYTIVAVGQLQDHPEGQQMYHYGQFGEADAVLPAQAVFSRQEAYRMVTELLQLECGVNQALTFAEVYNVNVTEVKLIKGLREAGYARPQEIDHMIRQGPKAYLEALEKFRTENPDAARGYTTNAWWEGEAYQKSRQRSDERAARALQALKDERTLEVEAIAKEWVRREYFRQSMAGTIADDLSEDEFSKTVWDRALLEGDMKYRVSKGEKVDEAGELATFQARQERKQVAMLKRAKEELKAVLQGDLTDDDDDNDEDDNDEPKK